MSGLTAPVVDGDRLSGRRGAVQTVILSLPVCLNERQQTQLQWESLCAATGGFRAATSTHGPGHKQPMPFEEGTSVSTGSIPNDGHRASQISQSQQLANDATFRQSSRRGWLSTFPTALQSFFDRLQESDGCFRVAALGSKGPATCLMCPALWPIGHIHQNWRPVRHHSYGVLPCERHHDIAPSSLQTRM